MKYFLLFLCLAYSTIHAQKFTISGSIKDEESGEHLIGANIYNLGTNQGTAANNYGFFSLTLNGDSVRLRVSYIGYSPKTINFFLAQDTVINIGLSNSSLLEEVVVTGTVEDKIQESSRMGTMDIPIEQIKAMPAFMGETDVFKVLQLLPGVQSGSEGTSGLYVRGGGPDQNLILLDGVPVYNAAHLFGFLSVFNADAINHVELIKGGFPARYGGRLSSVIDINMKEGNLKKIKGEGSISLIASKLTLEGPIKKDKASFIISARRTYIDILARPFLKNAGDSEADAGYYFYDLNSKINYRINERNRVYLSAYLGNDKAYSKYKETYDYDARSTESEDEAGLRWGNITTALRWNNIINKKLFSNITATYSRYRFDVFAKYNEKITEAGKPPVSEFYNSQYISGIRDYALKMDFDFVPTPNHYIKFGAQGIQHLFTPGVFNYKSNEEADTTFGQKKTSANEFYLYAEDDFLITEKLKINAGLHASGFFVNSKFYSSLQPRISGRYLLHKNLSAKASYAHMTQFIHLLTNAGLGLPTDLWVPATENIGPEKSTLTSVGFAYYLNQKYELSLEGYYKKMKGLIEYQEGASFLDIEKDWQTKVATGVGQSYGSELLFQKKVGKFSGWLGYTLSWTYRKFDEVNNGKWFPYKYDRRHDTEIALSYKLKENKEFSVVWVYGTGTALSLPTSTYEGANGSVQYYEGRNEYRMRPYHRLDVSYTTKKKTKWGERSWSISVYNVYNRRNPFFMDIGSDRQGNKKFIQYSLFPVLPSIAYHFNF